MHKSLDGFTTGFEDVPELNSSQEEADTHIILHCLRCASNLDDDVTIIVQSPDTDVFILLLKFISKIKQCVLFDTGCGNKRQLISVKDVIQDVGLDLCQVLPALHSFSVCDTTSVFVCKGKLLPKKSCSKNLCSWRPLKSWEMAWK